MFYSFISHIKEQNDNSNVHRPATATWWHCVEVFFASWQREQKKSERPHRPTFPSSRFLPATDSVSLLVLCLTRRDFQRHAASSEDPGEPRRPRPAGTHRGPAGQRLLQTRKGKDRRCCKSAMILNDVSLEAKLAAQCRPWL